MKICLGCCTSGQDPALLLRPESLSPILSRSLIIPSCVASIVSASESSEAINTSHPCCASDLSLKEYCEKQNNSSSSNHSKYTRPATNQCAAQRGCSVHWILCWQPLFVRAAAAIPAHDLPAAMFVPRRYEKLSGQDAYHTCYRTSPICITRQYVGNPEPDAPPPQLRPHISEAN